MTLLSLFQLFTYLYMYVEDLYFLASHMRPTFQVQSKPHAKLQTFSLSMTDKLALFSTLGRAHTIIQNLSYVGIWDFAGFFFIKLIKIISLVLIDIFSSGIVIQSSYKQPLQIPLPVRVSAIPVSSLSTSLLSPLSYPKRAFSSQIQNFNLFAYYVVLSRRHH